MEATCRCTDSLRSKPAEKARPSPWMTIARTCASLTKAVIASPISRTIAALIAFRTLGRLRVNTPIRPSKRVRIVANIIDLLSSMPAVASRHAASAGSSSLAERIPYSDAKRPRTSHVSECVRIRSVRNRLSELGSRVCRITGDVVDEYVVAPLPTRGQCRSCVDEKGRRYRPVKDTRGGDVGLL